MSILSLGQLAANQSSLYKLNQKAGTAAADVSKAAEGAVADTVEQDSASVASQRAQTKIASFREAAQGVAKNLAQVAFALRSTEAIGGKLADLQSLAKKALNEPLDSKALEKLNKAVKSARSNIDSAAQKNQLPQAAGQEAADADSQEVLPELNSTQLLGKEATLTSEADLRKFLAAVEKAAGQINSLNGDVRKMMDSYETMAIHFEISMQNQLAASSVIPQSSESSLLDTLFGNSGQALHAQGNRLSPEIMNLI